MPVLEAPDQLRPPGRLVVGVVADQRRADTVMAQELPGVPGVLRGDEVRLFQDPKAPEGDVLQVADGGGDDVEACYFAFEVAASPFFKKRSE